MKDKVEGPCKHYRLKNLKVRGVAIVDNPAIVETFYLFKNLGEKKLEKDEQFIIKTLEEVEKEFVDSVISVNSKVAKVKSTLEEYAQKEGTISEVKELLSKAINDLTEIEGMERVSPLLAFAQESVETVEKQKVDNVVVEKQVEEIAKSVVSFGEDLKTLKKFVEEELIKRIMQDMVGTVISTNVISTENLEKAMGAVTQKIDQISQEIEKKADKSEVPVRKGFGPSGKESPISEASDGTESSSLEKTKKSKGYQEASPAKRLLMLTQHFVESGI